MAPVGRRRAPYVLAAFALVVVVVAFGAGPRAARTTYDHWLTSSVETSNNCFLPWSDTVFTDRGPVRYCLK